MCRSRPLSLPSVSKHRARFEEEKAFVAEHNEAMSDIVELSIGGERFLTVPRRTLTRVGDSMLAAMFNGQHAVATDAQGRVLIDRNPRYCTMPTEVPCFSLLRERETPRLRAA